MNPQLNCPHRNTDDAISRHPAVRNLVWRDVRSMLRSLTEAAREPGGNLKVTRSGRTLTPPHASLDKNTY